MEESLHHLKAKFWQALKDRSLCLSATDPNAKGSLLESQFSEFTAPWAAAAAPVFWDLGLGILQGVLEP